MILFYISVIFFFVHTCLAVRPVIIEKIVDEVKPVDGTAMLNCTVALFENSDMGVEWWRLTDNKLLSQGSKISDAQNPIGPGDVPKYEIRVAPGRTSFIPNLGASTEIKTFTLVIKRLVNTDAGPYRCRILITGNSNLSPAVVGQLIVPREPFIKSSLMTQNQVVLEGSPVTLTCVADAEPRPRISWTRANGGAINIGKGDDNPQRVYNDTVVIPSITKEDRGVYRCHANNNVGQGALFDVRIDVQYAPSVKVARPNGMYGQAPDQNFEISMECLTEGYPDPEVRFYKGNITRIDQVPDKPLEDDNERHIERVRTQGSVATKIDSIFYIMKIFNVRSDMFGVYSCVASNDVGKAFAQFTFFRQEICQGALCYGQNSGSDSSAVTVKAHTLCTSAFVMAIFYLLHL